MNPFVRFWLLILSLAVALVGFGYLFLSFLFPDPAVVETASTVRLAVMAVSILATGVFLWAAVFASPEPSQQPVSKSDSQPPDEWDKL